MPPHPVTPLQLRTPPLSPALTPHLPANDSPPYELAFQPPEATLIVLGFSMVLVFMALILTRRLTPMVALIVVPTVFGLFAGAGLGLGNMVLDAIARMAPTAALLMFAIMFFGVMIDVGLFDPLIRWITRLLGHDPAKVVLGTALLAGAVSLDGDGSTTFIITVSAMLPIYLRLGMSPVVLTCVAGLINGTLNIVPWGGPTVRAATALGVQPSEVFVPMLPALGVGLAVALGFAWQLGLSERRRIGSASLQPESFSPYSAGAQPRNAPAAKPGARAELRTGNIVSVAGAGRVHLPQTAAALNTTEFASGTLLDPNRASLRPKLIWFNLCVTIAVMVLLVCDQFPLPFVFMVGAAVALLVNFPKLKAQSQELVAHAPSIVGVVSMVLAAGVLVGVLNGTGMVDAMAAWITTVIPSSLGPYLAVITGVLSIPFTFFMSNDAFYYGILPVLAHSAEAFGIAPVEMARASITGQPVHMQSPLVPAILLLVSLANVHLGDHHKKVLWRAAIVSLVMLAIGTLTGAVPLIA